MISRTVVLSLAGLASLALALPARAQRGGHTPPAASPSPAASFAPNRPADVIRALNSGVNAGSHAGSPSTPHFSTSVGSGGYNPTVPYYPPLIGAPNTWFPSRTTSLSTSPLFPYSSASYPLGYGFFAREPSEEEQRKPITPQRVLAPDAKSATMDVRVPAGAEIWFEGSKTGQRGTTRTFVSPPLEPGQGYTYAIRARWNEGGKDVEQTRKVSVHSSERVEVNFGASK
jgi:uncharacterized protein (TIGR03000 family)